jgi:surface protein
MEGEEQIEMEEKANISYPEEIEGNEKKSNEIKESTVSEKTKTGFDTTEKAIAQKYIDSINGKVLPYPDKEIPVIKIKNDEYLKLGVKSEIKISDYFNGINIDNNNNKLYEKKFKYCGNCHDNNNVYYCHSCKKNLCKKCREDIDICAHSDMDVIELGKYSNGIEKNIKNMEEMIDKIFNKLKQEKSKEKTDDIELIQRIIRANYINYFHYINIFECEQYLKNRYDKCFNKCCLKINYKVPKNRDEIQIFGDNFVKNNKDKLFLIINNRCSELISTKKILKDDYLEVILVQKSDIKITNLSYMFQECIYLNNFEKFKFHDLIDFNDVEDISYMFNKCNVIEELNLNLFGSFKKVKSMEGTFSECTLLKKINGMDKWNTKNVETMAGMFKKCLDLCSIEGIEIFDTRNVKDFSEMFSKCETLENIPDISNWDMGKATSLNGMFKKCSKIKNLPDFSQWDMSNVENISEMFKGCRALTSFPDYSKWKNLKKIVKTDGVFENCPYYNI